MLPLDRLRLRTGADPIVRSAATPSTPATLPCVRNALSRLVTRTSPIASLTEVTVAPVDLRSATTPETEVPFLTSTR